MSNIYFSVLISVYCKDDPSFFEKALESVTVYQTLQPNQIVIVEDGPVPKEIEDAITNVQKASGDIEFTIIRKNKNAGLAAALNTGLHSCRYEWVARMDSDDISVPDRFEKQINAIRGTDTDVIGGYIDEFSENIGDIRSIRKVGINRHAIMKMVKVRTPMNHVSVMYKKNTIIKIGGYSENFGKLEDYKLWVDLLNESAVLVNIPDVLVHVRVGNGFLERRSDVREIKDWDMLQDYLIKGNIIGKWHAFKNKLFIRAFIYTPTWIKKIMYSTVLRDK